MRVSKRRGLLTAALAAVALSGCGGPQSRDLFSETVDSLHARNSPLRDGKGAG